MANLLDLREVAKILKKSIPTLRIYKNVGIIEPISKDGAKHLYDKEEILMVKKLMADSNSINHDRSQLGRILREKRELIRKNKK